VPQVRGGEIVAGGVGDERGVAQALDGVEQGELGAGMGAFAAHDQAGARRPGVQVHEIGDLDHLGAVPDLPARFAGRFPVLFGHQQKGVADPAVDPVTEGEADVARPAFLGEPVGGPGGIGADQQVLGPQSGVVARLVAGLPVGWELGDRRAEHDDVIGGAVRPRVARPEHPGQHLAGLGQHGGQRVMPVRALMRRRGVFFVGLGPHDRRVHIDDRRVAGGTRAGRPRGGPGLGSGTSKTAQLGRPKRCEGPLGAGPGRHRPEQLGLAPQRLQVGQALSPISQGHHHLRQADARVVTAARCAVQHLAEPGGQAAAIRDLAQPHQPRTRHEALAVTGHGPWPDQPDSFPH
jgi:hypothetical protein